MAGQGGLRPPERKGLFLEHSQARNHWLALTWRPCDGDSAFGKNNPRYIAIAKKTRCNDEHNGGMNDKVILDGHGY